MYLCIKKGASNWYIQCLYCCWRNKYFDLILIWFDFSECFGSASRYWPGSGVVSDPKACNIFFHYKKRSLHIFNKKFRFWVADLLFWFLSITEIFLHWNQLWPESGHNENSRSASGSSQKCSILPDQDPQFYSTYIVGTVFLLPYSIKNIYTVHIIL